MRYGTWEEYPFPLSDGSLLWLRIPGATLSHEDATRLCQYVHTLVTDAPEREPGPEADYGTQPPEIP